MSYLRKGLKTMKKYQKAYLFLTLLLCTSCGHLNTQQRNTHYVYEYPDESSSVSEQEFAKLYENSPELNQKSIVVRASGSEDLQKAPLRESTLTQILQSYSDQLESTPTNQYIQLSESPGPKSESFLKKVASQRVEKWIQYYKKNGHGIQQHINRGQKVRPLVESIFERYGVPKDLYFVGLVESGYKVNALSSAKAKGAWQFMPATGKKYGLMVSPIDERVHLVKSTIAAAKYFKDLYNIFGSWELALSSYNAGEYGMIRRIQKGQTRDFYELAKKDLLPEETQNYIPKVLALMEIHQHPKKYGIQVPHYEKHPYMETKVVPLNRPVPLKVVSHTLGISVKEIKELNPELKSDQTPVKEGGYELYVPNHNYGHVKTALSQFRAPTPQIVGVEKKDQERKVSSSPKENLASSNLNSTHKVLSGENLSLIARKYKLSIAEIQKINGLKNSRIYPGQVLKVQKAPVYKPIVYSVKKGDNLTLLANKLGIEISQLKKMNNLKTNTLSIGQELKLPETKKLVHTVKQGEYLRSIASKYQNSPDFIRWLNGIKGSTIYPGQKIVVNYTR